jgi:hypothetical protein
MERSERILILKKRAREMAPASADIRRISKDEDDSVVAPARFATHCGAAEL